jgi:acyl-coenzyme A synthetase/AMP-(fatty) acid ligase
VNPVESVLEHARTAPEDLAVAAADFTMTYGEMADSLVRFAARFRQLGIGKGSVVAVHGHPGIQSVVILALLHEGAISLTGSAAVLRAYSANIDLIVADGPVVNAGETRVLTITSDLLASLGSVSTAIEPAVLSGDDVCRIVFSSGTTGTPKGVEFTVAALAARTDSARTNWMPVDPFMCLLGLDTVSGIQTFYWCLFHGTTYLASSSAEANRALIERYGVRSIKTSPARLADLVAAVEATHPIHLEVVQVAGSLLTPSVGERAERVLGPRPVYLYGSTEIGTVASGIFDPDRPHVVGRLAKDVDFQLVDAAGAPITEPGVEGAVRYRSRVMTSHYWLAELGGDSAFRDGWFYPGDLGSMSVEGELQLSGRSTDVVNANGSKFNLAELDMWLGELRIFTDAASFSFVDGDGVAVGIAFVAKAHVGPEVVMEQLRSRFPNIGVKALLKIDEIPRNQLGKVDRPALVALLGDLPA